MPHFIISLTNKEGHFKTEILTGSLVLGLKVFTLFILKVWDYICCVQGFVLSLPLSQDMVVQKKKQLVISLNVPFKWSVCIQYWTPTQIESLSVKR